MPVEGDYECFSDDWRRTHPDLVLNLPSDAPAYREAQDHVLVDFTPGGDLLAIWTMACKASGDDMGVFYARSGDGGARWSAPAYLHEPGPRPGQLSSFGFPVISRSGRIYCFYNWSSGVGEGLLNAVLRCRYSDDDGHSWIEGGVEIPYRRTRFDHPDPSVQPIGIVWQKPVRDALDRPVAGLTRTTAAYVRPATDASHMGGLPNRPGGRPWHRWMGECRCEFVRFDNIDEGPDPRDVRVTWLPDDEELIWVPVTFEPQASEGLTFCQEPGLVLLPDDRLFTAMRTSNGDIWYTVSDDHGHSWRPSEVLRYRDGGERMLNPIAPTPMFRLEDGRYLLFLQNHDGWGYGGHGPRDLSSRRPQFLSVGEFRPGAHQPVWFSEPLFLFDAEVGLFPNYMTWQSLYASMTERDGRRILWYTDRKLFALGRFITDEMLAPLTVPA